MQKTAVDPVEHRNGCAGPPGGEPPGNSPAVPRSAAARSTGVRYATLIGLSARATQEAPPSSGSRHAPSQPDLEPPSPPPDSEATSPPSDSEPTSPRRAAPARGRGARRFGLAAATLAIAWLGFELVSILGRPHHALAGDPQRREQIAAEAASLLSAAPQPVRRRQPPLAAPVEITVEPPPGPTDGPQQLADLRGFAAATAHETPEPVPATSSPGRGSSVPDALASIALPPLGETASGPVPARRPPAAPIPDSIEGRQAPVRAGDPLAPLTIDATLQTLAAGTAPFELRAIRIDAGPARAKLAARSHELARESDGGGHWYEVGDVPLRGWIVVGIAGDAATLMTPLGNLVKLRLEPPPGGGQGKVPPQ